MIFETWKLLDHLNMTFAYRSLSQVMFFPLQNTTTPTEGEQSQHSCSGKAKTCKLLEAVADIHRIVQAGYTTKSTIPETNQHKQTMKCGEVRPYLFPGELFFEMMLWHTHYWLTIHYTLTLCTGNFPVGLVLKKGRLFSPKRGSKNRSKSRPPKVPNQTENYYSVLTLLYTLNQRTEILILDFWSCSIDKQPQVTIISTCSGFRRQLYRNKNDMSTPWKGPLVLGSESNCKGTKAILYMVDPVGGPPQGQQPARLTLWRPLHRVHGF